MTLSILALDRDSGEFGGAAMTASYCVGGWVLRGNATAGLSASQGTSPSTLWGEQILSALVAGETAEAAVARVTAADPGRDHRQCAALDGSGRTAAFTGARSVKAASAIEGDAVVVAGNMLTSAEVLDAALEAFTRTASRDLALRLLAALDGAEALGGDSRGLTSAALLVLGQHAPPLDLRIDSSRAPLTALRHLLSDVRSPPYSTWITEVPTLSDPFRSPGTS